MVLLFAIRRVLLYCIKASSAISRVSIARILYRFPISNFSAKIGRIQMKALHSNLPLTLALFLGAY